METIALTKPDMAVVRAQMMGGWPFGVQTDTFVQSIFARIRVGRGAYSLLSLEYLLEEETAAEVVAPTHEYHLHFDVQAIRNEKGVFAAPHVVRVEQRAHPEKTVRTRGSVYQVFSKPHMAAHATPFQLEGRLPGLRAEQAPVPANKHISGVKTALKGQKPSMLTSKRASDVGIALERQKQPAYRQSWRTLYTGIQWDAQHADVSSIAADGSSFETDKQVRPLNGMVLNEVTRMLHTIRETTTRAARANSMAVAQMPMERQMLQAALRQSNALRRRGLAYQAEQPFASFRVTAAAHTQPANAAANDAVEAHTPDALEYLPGAGEPAPISAVIVREEARTREARTREARTREAWGEEDAAVHTTNIPPAFPEARYMAQQRTQPEAEGAGLEMLRREVPSELVHPTKEATAEKRGAQGILQRLGLRGKPKDVAALRAQQNKAAEDVRGRRDLHQDLSQVETGTASPTGMPVAVGAVDATVVQAREYVEVQQSGRRSMENTQDTASAPSAPIILTHPVDGARLLEENAARQPVFTAQQAKRYEQEQAKGELRLQTETTAHAGKQWQPRHSQAAKAAMNKAQADMPSALEYTLGQQQARLEPDSALAELPEWAQAYMAHAQREQAPQATDTAAQEIAIHPEVTDAGIARRMAISKPDMTKPVAATVRQMAWAAPGYAVLKPPEMAHAQREQAPQAVGTVAQESAMRPEATEASIVRRMAISRPDMKQPLAAPMQQIVWTAPGYAAQKPPQMAHKEKQPEAAVSQPKPVRISDAEINRMANKIYGILEDKLRVERRRMGY